MNARTLRDLKAVANNLRTEAVLLGPSRARAGERLLDLARTLDYAIQRLEQEETAA